MPGTPIHRRELFRGAGAAALGASLGSRCAGGRRSQRELSKVQVSPDRVIREVAGLRPFRPSGFRLDSETYDEKTVIHNYGHGGGGVTLSWGTGHLAVEEALKTGATRYAVLGCGAVGLAAARLLQQKGFEVTIYARDLPPRTTSNVACASWYPSETADPNQRSEEWIEKFTRAARLSHRYFQDLVGEVYGVRWIEEYILDDEPMQEYFSRTDEAVGGLFPARSDLERRDHPFGFEYCRRHYTMLIEPPIYLNALLRDFRIAGGKVVIRELASVEDVLRLPEPAVVNATGIGARQIFQDEELMPIKGQLTVLLPQPEVDYIMVQGGLYMMPRKDGILLGGTHERGDWSLDPNPVEAQRLMNGHQEFFARMA